MTGEGADECSRQEGQMPLPDASSAMQAGLRMLGIAYRARKVALGSDAVLRSIRGRSAALVLLAADAGENVRKKVRDKCKYYGIPCVERYERDALGGACGRGGTIAVAVTDPGIAAKVISDCGEFSGGEAFDETSSL